MIRTDSIGFMTAKLDTDISSAMLRASYDDASFYVYSGRDDEPEGQFFTAPDCHEAAAFFKQLADELERLDT